MELQHINFKIFVENPESIDQEIFTLIFQNWIQDQVCEELLIDVADYLHVDAGPGIVLIGEEADYGMDNTGHRLGLRYNRKTGLARDNSAKLAQALRSTLLAAQRLEADPRMGGKLRFSRHQLEFFINDRAIAPNTPESWEACGGDLEKFFSRALKGTSFDIVRQENPRERFGLIINAAQNFDINGILQNL